VDRQSKSREREDNIAQKSTNSLLLPYGRACAFVYLNEMIPNLGDGAALQARLSHTPRLSLQLSAPIPRVRPVRAAQIEALLTCLQLFLTDIDFLARLSRQRNCVDWREGWISFSEKRGPNEGSAVNAESSTVNVNIWCWSPRTISIIHLDPKAMFRKLAKLSTGDTFPRHTETIMD
jgi:hypothetical protein